MIRFGVLGPLEVRRDGQVADLGGPRHALLAVLLVHANEPVGADALIQALSGEEAPPTAAKALQMAVSRLREALGPDAGRLQTSGGGYRLVVEPGELERGGHARLAGELEALVVEHPLRERLRGQQMLALYRAGRHAEALAAFRAARDALDTDLGLEPGPELRRLEQAILTHDPSLTAPAPAGVPPAPPTPTFGREDDVRRILGALQTTRLLTLVGPGGVGKTRLAALLAGRVEPALAAFGDELATARAHGLRGFDFEGLLGIAPSRPRAERTGAPRSWRRRRGPTPSGTSARPRRPSTSASSSASSRRRGSASAMSRGRRRRPQGER